METTDKQHIIELKNVYKSYYTRDIETQALFDINLSIKQGDFISIMGPSGCGKSTLLNVMGLLEKPSRGTIKIANLDTENLRDKELARLRNQKIGFVFQKFHLIPALNIIDNVELPLLYRKQISSRKRYQKAVEVLEKVGLTNRMKHFPGQLSGGQCQRVAIARAIIGSPEIIYADEPTGNLDSKMSQEIIELLTQLNKEGTTIVLVTHDKQIAQQTQDIIHMLDGKLIGESSHE